MKLTRSFSLLVGVVLISGCAADPIGSANEAQPPSSASPSGEPFSPAPQITQLPRPIDVGELPPVGFVTAAQRGGATLVALDGSVIDRLDGFRLAGNPENKRVWLQRGRGYFRLDSRRGRLLPVERQRARTQIYAARPEPDLPAPAGARYRGRVAGRWSYALKGPGGHALVQWSGECESPMAFWVVGGRSVSLVTGERGLSGPESIALGWAPDGSAYAYLGEGLCGRRADPPGIYRFTAPGKGRLVYRTRALARVHMW